MSEENSVTLGSIIEDIQQAAAELKEENITMDDIDNLIELCKLLQEMVEYREAKETA
jgi:hypothetical protein